MDIINSYEGGRGKCGMCQLLGDSGQRRWS